MYARTLRRSLGALLLLAMGTAPAPASSSDVAVPVPVQAALIGKVLSYDRSLDARAGDRVHVAIVVDPGSPASTKIGDHIRAALGELPTMGGKPHDEFVVNFSNESALVETCKTKKISLVYVTPVPSDLVGRVVRALDTKPILTVAAVPDDVARKIVLGFDVVSGKPKLLIHLDQAKRQGVDFRADVLKLAKVVQ